MSSFLAAETASVAGKKRLLLGILLVTSVSSALADSDILLSPAGKTVASIMQQGSGPVPLSLTSKSFDSVVTKIEAGTEEWVVFFCVEWLEQCQEMRRVFRSLGNSFERTLNANRIWAPAVRFAEVDCAADKVLCNTQNVEWYPTVQHYIGGKSMQAWHGKLGRNQKSMDKEVQKLSTWLQSRLGPNRKVKEEVSVVPKPSLLRLIPFSMALAAMMAYVIGLSLGLWQNCQEMVWGRTELVKESSTSCSREQALALALAAGDQASVRIARRLPAEWADQRRCIEL